MRCRASSSTIKVCTQTSPSVPFRLLRTVDERLYLNSLSITPRSSASRKPMEGRWPEATAFDLPPDAFGRKIVERDAPAQVAGGGFHVEFESCGKLHGAQHPETVVAKRPGIDGAKNADAQIGDAIVRIEVFTGQRIESNGVDGEVAPSCGFRERHLGVAFDGEPAMFPAGLRIPPRQRDVDIADLVDGKALADDVDAAEAGEEVAQLAGGNAEHLEIDVLRDATHEAIAHPSTDDQCSSAPFETVAAMVRTSSGASIMDLCGARICAPGGRSSAAPRR